MASNHFQDIQRAFAARIREPSNPLPTGVSAERMDLYRELFRYNIESFLETGFPVLRGVLQGDRWDRLVDAFFKSHLCQTPYFNGIYQEFLTFLGTGSTLLERLPPFTRELAHYEWVELAVAIDEDEPPTFDDRLHEDPLQHDLSLSPTAWPLAYRFPVHRICLDFQPEHAPDSATYLVVFRDPHDRVRFLELNAVSYRLLTLLDQDGPLPGKQCIEQIAVELGHSNPEPLSGYAKVTLQDLIERGIIGRTPT